MPFKEQQKYSENLLIINKKPKGLDKGQIVGGGFGGKPFLGVNTDKKTKRIGCATLKSLLVENKLLINDIDTISELSTFIEVRDSYQADDGYHDDLVMGLVIFGWLTTQPYFKELIGLSGASQFEPDAPPSFVGINGLDEEQVEDMKWLLS